MSKKNFPKWLSLSILVVLSSILLANMAAGSDLQLKVKVKSAKIRLDASQDSPVVGTLSKGEIINPESEKGDWYLITFSNKETGYSLSGYIHKTDVEDMGEDIQAEPTQQELIFGEKSKKANNGFPLSFYLSGNYRFVNGADLNPWIDRYEDIYSDANDYFTWPRLESLPEINFEIIYSISEYFGFGLGMGYLFFPNVDANYGWEQADGDYSDYTRDIEMNALFFSGNLYGTIPIGNSFAFNLTAGGDFYLGKYSQILDSDWDYWNFTSIIIWPWIITIYTHEVGNTVRDEDTTCNTFGFHVGGSFDIKISPNIAFVVGGIYRLIKFKNFYGTYNYKNLNSSYTDNYEGYLYYNTEDPYIRLYEDAPTGADWRKAVLDLSGFAIQVGIRISNLFSKKK